MNQQSVSIWDLRYLDAGEAYDESQTNDFIKTGDVLLTQEGIAIMYSAWPTMVFGTSKALHTVASSWDAILHTDVWLPEADMSKLRQGFLVAWALALG